ncbi:hypothetical protein C0993_004574 [Termitomyces sp. T159_Od127]|nr:hypothetical protein C0993_004574 [Termitomyces sp. T159_Od127]
MGSAQQQAQLQLIWAIPSGAEDLDSAYQIALSNDWTIHNVFHVSCLIPAHMDTIIGCKQELPLLVRMETGNKVEIKQILWEQSIREEFSEFLVHWKGYNKSKDKWLKEYNMLHAVKAIQEFHASKKARGERRHKKHKG